MTDERKMAVMTDLDLAHELGMSPKDIGEIKLFSFEDVKKAIRAQARITATYKEIVLDATIKSVLGEGPQHCARHPHFVDECTSCQNIVNENVDWALAGRLQELLDK